MAARLFDQDGRVFADYLRPDNAVELPPVPQPEGSRFVEGQLVLFRSVVRDGERLGVLHLQASMAAY
jgi:hypothetical protein